MRIINTDRKQETGSRKQEAGNKFFWLIIFIFAFCLSGCAKRVELRKAQDYLKDSERYYQLAINEYQDSISQGKDLDRLYFELGKVYYDHKDFLSAINAFQKTKIGKSKKFLAISYYRLGNFTDALEVFTKNEINDPEYLYFYGLTCEKLNLFGKAQSIYSKITDGIYKDLAGKRIDEISRLSKEIYLNDLTPDLQKIIREAPSQEAYPQAGALILSVDEHIEITQEDSAVYEDHVVIKVLNERGKKEFSEVAVGYDSTYEKVELIYARTIKPDGRVVSAGAKHIRDVSKYLNYPLYSNARVYIISMPEITEGAVIEYKIRVRRNQLINKKDLTLSYYLQEKEPIIAASFQLALPQGKEINIKLLNEVYNKFNADLHPKINKKDEKVIYKWQFRDVPQIIPEPSMPAIVEVNPLILISTFDSWDEIYAWWWDLAKESIKATKEIKDKTQGLIADKKSKEDKIRAIYNYCAKNIRYVAVEYGQAGHQPHKAEEIFANKYGDCKDQAVLLVTMLREAGFKAYPVLIGTQDSLNLQEDFPTVLFNHCIAAVELGTEMIFLDPTAETCPFADLPAGDQERRVLLFQDDGYRILSTPIYENEHNSVIHDIKIEVDEQEAISAKKVVKTRGIYEQGQRFWLIYTQPELIEQSLKEKIQQVSIGAELIDYCIENVNDLNKEVNLEYRFKGPEYWTPAGALRILPQLATGIGSSIVAKDKRNYPIDFKLLDTRIMNFNIAIPHLFKVKYLPEDVYIDNPWFEFSAQYSLNENRIDFQEQIKLKKRKIEISEYQEFKKIILDLGKKVKHRVVLEKQG